MKGQYKCTKSDMMRPINLLEGPNGSHRLARTSHTTDNDWYIQYHKITLEIDIHYESTLLPVAHLFQKFLSHFLEIFTVGAIEVALQASHYHQWSDLTLNHVMATDEVNEMYEVSQSEEAVESKCVQEEKREEIKLASSGV